MPFRGYALICNISIHAPRGGSDDEIFTGGQLDSISIHAPRGGSDFSKDSAIGDNKYFNPRSPWGERQNLFHRITRNIYFNPRSPWGERPPGTPRPSPPGRFQSTLPVGGATGDCNSRCGWIEISIHAPRGGSDQNTRGHRKRTDISIHAPRGGSDCHGLMI